MSRDLLRRALKARRRALGSLRDDPGAGGAAGDGTAAASEESLRRFMVVAWPAAGRHAGDDGARALFLELLAGLEEAARSDDLRFLDAWNNAWETMQGWPPDRLAAPDARRVLRAYAALLDLHIDRMAGPP